MIQRVGDGERCELDEGSADKLSFQRFGYVFQFEILSQI